MNYTKRVGSMKWKPLAVFLLAFALGGILSVFITPIINPLLQGIGLGTVLATVIFGSVTVSYIVIQGILTFIALVPLNRYFGVRRD